MKGDVYDEQELRSAQGTNRQFSESHFISCWHLYEGQTLRMWDEQGEVAIFSTYALLHEALNVLLDEVDVSAVRYGHEHINRSTETVTYRHRWSDRAGCPAETL